VISRDRLYSVVVVAAAALSVAPAPAAELEVVPGAVVRWPGADLEKCSIGTSSWDPVDGACWYGIDLLQPAGPLELRRTRAGRVETSTVRVGVYPYPEQHLQVADSKVNLSTDDLNRTERESARIATIWRRPGAAAFDLPLAGPLPTLEEGRNFGARRVLNGAPRSPHSGIDYRAGRGTEVRAVADGVVVIAEDHFFGGNSVFVDHGNELVSMYMHFDRIDVVEGQEVTRGDVLGAAGDTGRATGPHLHFGLRWHGARIDPKFLFGDVAAVPVITE
jgi:murein DD-endopeptidase MepM/ murein hydrolase activator NlpD